MEKKLEDLAMNIFIEFVEKLKNLSEYERNWVIETLKSYFEKA